MSPTDLPRLIENLIQTGTIASVDAVAARCTVRVGGLITTPVPWLSHRAGEAADWWAPTVGEQVLLLAPGGDLARSIAITGIYSDAHPAPGQDPAVRLDTYPDGAVVSYDSTSHTLAATLPDGGKARLTAPGGAEVIGDVKITGKLHTTDKARFDADLDCGATVTADTDVVGGGKSLKEHKHTGVTSGGGVSGPPQ